MKTLFLQKNSNFIVNEKVNLILSCEFYWIRVFDIPISSHKDVLAVLPSFFEDYFDTTNYKYYIIKKQEHKYICFAYKEADIINAIKSSNLQIKLICDIYFAQNEFINQFNEGKCYKIKNSIYSLQDDSIIKLPQNIAQNIICDAFDYDSIKLSKYKITINQASKYIELKTSIILSVMIMLFSVFTFAKTIYINTIASNYVNKTNEVTKKYKLLPSKIQTKSLIVEYSKVKEKYEKFTSALEYILNYKKIVNTKVIDIEFRNNILKVRFEKKSRILIKKYIENKYNNVAFKIEQNTFVAELKI